MSPVKSLFLLDKTKMWSDIQKKKANLQKANANKHFAT